MKIIDPHIHLFNIKTGDYHWLKEGNAPFWRDKAVINKNFAEQDLTLTSPLTLAAFVHIEAGFDNNQPWRELEALKQSCKKTYKAIANIDFTLSSDEFTQTLTTLAKFRSFIGVRHILDEQAQRLLTKQQVLTNIKMLNTLAININQNLVFETQLALSDTAAIDSLCKVVSANTKLHFIINHAGFPPANINTTAWQHWQSNLAKLAAYPNVAIKCSGWEMTNRSYTQEWLNENLTLVYTIFGAKKMMLASNFPLCLFSKKSYQDYWQTLITGSFFQTLTAQEKSALSYDNALYWYSLNH